MGKFSGIKNWLRKAWSRIAREKKNVSGLPRSNYALTKPKRYIALVGLGSFLSLAFLVSILASTINCTLQKKFCDSLSEFQVIHQTFICFLNSAYNAFREQTCESSQHFAEALSNSSGTSEESAMSTTIASIAIETSYDFGNILIFSLALVVASITYTVALLRGNQVIEQINKIQEQSNLTRFQNALGMATDVQNKGRCVSGLTILEEMYKDLDELSQETVVSVARHVLSKQYAPFESRRPPTISGHQQDVEEIKLIEGIKVSRTARQRAFDFLFREGFFPHRSGNKRSGVSTNQFFADKDFSRLRFTKKGDSELNLSGVFFRNCDFFGANLSRVNFTNANFAGSKLYGANFSGANFTGVKGFPTQHLYFAYYSEKHGPAIGFSPEDSRKIDEWSTWKAYLRGGEERDIEKEKLVFKIKNLKAGEWEYMVHLAMEDAEHPPGEDYPEASKIQPPPTP